MCCVREWKDSKTAVAHLQRKSTDKARHSNQLLNDKVEKKQELWRNIIDHIRYMRSHMNGQLYFVRDPDHHDSWFMTHGFTFELAMFGRIYWMLRLMCRKKKCKKYKITPNEITSKWKVQINCRWNRARHKWNNQQHGWISWCTLFVFVCFSVARSM